MKEDYLHQIWEKKRLPFHQMRLTDGSIFTIKKTGKHNKESGPDFFDGEVIIDGVRWRGNIEIHVKSSDWNLHKHQFDPAYNNVILHVVYEHDKEIMIHNRVLPTLELKRFLEIEHFKLYLKSGLTSSQIICDTWLSEFDAIYLESMKEKAIIERLNRKTSLLTEPDKFVSYHQLLYQMLGQAFGMKVNTMPFQELTHRLPLRIIKRENSIHTQSLILGASGVICSDKMPDWDFFKSKYALTSLSKYAWKNKGLRSAGFPLRRLYQFSEVVEKFDFDTTFIYLTSKNTLEYLYKLMEFRKNKETLSLEMSVATKDLIIINCFVPFIWWYGNLKSDEVIKEKALEILSLLKAEKNNILSKWSQIGITPKNAYDSQALLEIYNEFCSEKKCLSCTIGNKIMNG